MLSVPHVHAHIKVQLATQGRIESFRRLHVYALGNTNNCRHDIKYLPTHQGTVPRPVPKSRTVSGLKEGSRVAI